jgi:hypothetical protein
MRIPRNVRLSLFETLVSTNVSGPPPFPSNQVFESPGFGLDIHHFSSVPSLYSCRGSSHGPRVKPRALKEGVRPPLHTRVPSRPSCLSMLKILLPYAAVTLLPRNVYLQRPPHSGGRSRHAKRYFSFRRDQVARCRPRTRNATLPWKRGEDRL